MSYDLIRSATREARKNHRWHLECNEAARDYFNSGVSPEFSRYENERLAQGAAVKLIETVRYAR